MCSSYEVMINKWMNVSLRCVCFQPDWEDHYISFFERLFLIVLSQEYQKVFVT